MFIATIKLNEVGDIGEFVHKVSSFSFDLQLKQGRYVVDAKSLLGIMSLNRSEDMKLCSTDDCDKEAVIKAIGKFTTTTQDTEQCLHDILPKVVEKYKKDTDGEFRRLAYVVESIGNEGYRLYLCKALEKAIYDFTQNRVVLDDTIDYLYTISAMGYAGNLDEYKPVVDVLNDTYIPIACLSYPTSMDVILCDIRRHAFDGSMDANDWENIMLLMRWIISYRETAQPEDGEK